MRFFQLVSELYNAISPTVEMTAFQIEDETEDEIEIEAEAIVIRRMEKSHTSKPESARLFSACF